MNIDLDVDALMYQLALVWVWVRRSLTWCDIPPSQEGNMVRFLSSALAIRSSDLRLHIDMEFEAIQSNIM